MQVRTKMILIEGLQLKVDLTRADKDAEESEPSYTACVMRNGTATVTNSLAVSQNIKHGDAIWSNFTHKHTAKGGEKENICSFKNV